eukprot:1403252-Rhodomonas_salina.1
MRLYAGDEVVFLLYGFVGERPNNISVISSPPGAMTEATWDQTTSRLTLNVTATVEPDTLVLFEVPASARIKLPKRGVLRGGVEIMAFALNGNVLPSLVEFEKIGSFTTTTTLVYSNPRAGQLSNLVLDFTATMPIEDNKIISVNLPGFSGPTASRFAVTTQLPATPGTDYFLYANWNNELKLLDLITESELPADTPVRILIEAAEAQIRLPIVGTDEDSTLFTLSVTAAEGIVRPTPIWTSPPVGSTTTTVTVFFSENAKPGFATDISLEFFAEMLLYSTDTIWLALPGFSKSGGSYIDPDDVITVPEGLFTATWLANTSTLQFVVKGPISEEQRIEIKILERANIVVSPFGVRASEFFCPSPCSACPCAGACDEQPPVTLATNASAGPIEPTPVYTIQPIGVVLDTTLSVDPPSPNQPVNITVSFVPLMPVKPRETFSVILQGFSSADFTNVPIQPAGSTCSWDSMSSTLTCRTGSCLERQQTATFIIPDTAGLRSPMFGLRRSQSAITLAVAAAAGPVEHIAFDNFPVIGNFLHTQLEYDPPRVNTISELTFTAEATMILQRGDYLVLSFPGLTGALKCKVTVETDPPGVAAEADWTGPGNEAANCRSQHDYDYSRPWETDPYIPYGEPKHVIIWINATVLPGTRVRYVIDSNSGITIPATGTNENDETITVWTNAYDGAVPPSPPLSIMFSDQIRERGTLYDSTLSFGTPRWDTVTSVTMVFRVNVILIPGDYFQITLPGFSRSNGTVACNDVDGHYSSAVAPPSLRAEGESSKYNLTTVGWDNGVLKICIQDHSPSNFTFTTVIPASFGIKLPATGVNLDTAIKIEADLTA